MGSENTLLQPHVQPTYSLSLISCLALVCTVYLAHKRPYKH